MIRTKRFWLFCFAGTCALFLFRPAAALDPQRNFAQYLRDNWTVEDGFAGGPVSALAQTPDGCLWIGGERGLVRFDGVNFELVQHSSQGAPISHVLGLATDREGGLWIWMQGANVLRFHDGIFENIISGLSFPNEVVTAMSPTGDGGLLLATLGQDLFEYRYGALRKVAAGRLPGSLTLASAKTTDGTVWVGTSDNGLFSVVDGDLHSVLADTLPKKINTLLAGADNTLWIGTDAGLYAWNGKEVIAASHFRALQREQILTLASDRDHNLWVGTSHSFFRLQGPLAENPTPATEKADLTPSAIFQDREGDLWIGSSQGLQRWRDSIFTKYVEATRSVSGGGALFASPQGRTWFAPANGGLQWTDGGRTEWMSLPRFADDVVYSIAGQGADVWIGRKQGGLTHLSEAGERTYTKKDGLPQNSVYSVLETQDGTVWAGTLNAGLSRLRGNVFQTFTSADGLASNTISGLEEDGAHALWVATPDGLSTRVAEGWRTYRAADGLPSDEITALQGLNDSSGGVWVGTAKGLALVSSGHVRTFPELSSMLSQVILGLAQDRGGFLWIATTSQILRVDRAKLLADDVRDLDLRSFNQADGVLPAESTRRSRPMIADSSGAIWIATRAGLYATNPKILARISAPSITQVNNLFADGRSIPLRPARVPTPPSRITIQFSAVSLPVPERVRYRYRLDGFDKGWSEITSGREAVYTRLDPGSYRFRLMATNSEGAWNAKELSFPFTIRPAFWQTPWFRLCLLLLVLLIARWLYLLRMRQLARQLNLRFEERLAERMRVAQDLHDTLMQGFLSASMQLDVATDYVPQDSPAAAILSRVLSIMKRATEDTRTSLTKLRAPGHLERDLEADLSHIPQELGREQPIGFRVVVNGSLRPLNPVCSNDVFLIAREAVLNAYRHAEARNIEVEITYEASFLRLAIRDDGKGMDQDVVRAGREGHWGLSGMRERATDLGAKIQLWSRPSQGTEIELAIPGDLAYVQGKASRSWSFFLKPVRLKTRGIVPRERKHD